MPFLASVYYKGNGNDAETHTSEVFCITKEVYQTR